MKIKHLGIENSKSENLSYIPEGVFSDLKNTLNTLALGACPIKKISKKAFDGLVSLQYLRLDRLDIENLDPDYFKDLHSLKELSLTGNKITEVPKEIFSVLKKVNFLTLSGNRIEVIHPAAFKGLESLRLLHLNDNAIQEFLCDEASKNSLKELKILNISNNCLMGIGLKSFEDQDLYDATQLFPKTVLKDNFRLLADGNIAPIGYEPQSARVVFEHLNRARGIYLPGIFQMALDDKHSWCPAFSDEQKNSIRQWKEESEKKMQEKISNEGEELLLCLNKKVLPMSPCFDKNVLPIIFNQFGGYPVDKKLLPTFNEESQAACAEEEKYAAEKRAITHRNTQ